MLKAPFPWFGGKSKVADIVWQHFGDVPNYVEPFFGSGAVLLNRPHNPKTETINDKDGYVANFWRAIKNDPEQVAYYADNPVNENDLHARHIWLVNQQDDFVPKLEADPDFYNAKIAGYWVWGMCSWIAGGFCTGKGPWQNIDGKLIKTSNKGIGIKRQLPHLNGGQGINRVDINILSWFNDLAERLRKVRVCCGDWKRVCGYSPTIRFGLTGVFLDPPYSQKERDSYLYTTESATAASECMQWCSENGDNPKLRIALCGYDTEHVLPGWKKYHWKTQGGYCHIGNARGKINRARETIWFSPSCLDEITMFD